MITTNGGGTKKRMKPDVNQSLNSKSKKRKNERIQCQSEQMTKENTFQNTDRVLSNYSFPFPSYKKNSYSVSQYSKSRYTYSIGNKMYALQDFSISDSTPFTNKTRKASKLSILLKSRQPDGSYAYKHPYLHITQDEISRCIISCTIK